MKEETTLEKIDRLEAEALELAQTINHKDTVLVEFKDKYNELALSKEEVLKYNKELLWEIRTLKQNLCKVVNKLSIMI